MMRKLTTTGLAALALAGLAGTGAAFAAPAHNTKPPAGAVSTDRSGKETSVGHRESRDKRSKENSSPDRAHESHSADRAHESRDSTR